MMSLVTVEVVQGYTTANPRFIYTYLPLYHYTTNSTKLTYIHILYIVIALILISPASAPAPSKCAWYCVTKSTRPQGMSSSSPHVAISSGQPSQSTL